MALLIKLLAPHDRPTRHAHPTAARYRGIIMSHVGYRKRGRGFEETTAGLPGAMPTMLTDTRVRL
jgi:hypothetical protein